MIHKMNKGNKSIGLNYIVVGSSCFIAGIIFIVGINIIYGGIL